MSLAELLLGAGMQSRRAAPGGLEDLPPALAHRFQHGLSVPFGGRNDRSCLGLGLEDTIDGFSHPRLLEHAVPLRPPHCNIPRSGQRRIGAIPYGSTV